MKMRVTAFITGTAKRCGIMLKMCFHQGKDMKYRYEFFGKSQLLEFIAVVIEFRWACHIFVILLC